MCKCCGKVDVKECDRCSPRETSSNCGRATEEHTPSSWFENMIDNCYDYASAARKSGKPIVGILCEYTPRELIMAAGAVPVCLCGGSVETIYSAEEDLPANLCPLIKSTYGFHVEGSNPFLEMADLIVAETTCDGKKKMYELMAETRPMYVLELPHKAADTDSFEHWVLELKKFKHELEVRFSTTITDDGLREAMKQMNRERSLRRQLAALMKAKHPPLTGRELLDFKSSISCIQTDLDQYQAAIEHYTAKETDLSAPSRVRVLLTGVPVVHGAEKVVDIIEDRGGLIVCMENCTGIKPIIEDVEEQTDDPIRSIAEKYFHLHCSVMTPNERRLEAIESLAKDYNADCVIDLIWQACLTYDIESRRVKRLVEQKLGIPYLRIETDYSPSDSSRIAVRVEALFETILGSGKRSAQ